MLTPSHCCPAGWWTGSKQSEPGRVGIFPGSYVEGLGLAEAAVAAAGEAAGEAEGAEGAELALELGVGCGLAGRVAPRAGAPPPAATLQPPDFLALPQPLTPNP